MAVFVLDRHGRPLMPCSEKRARKLHEDGRTRVHRMVPFTIRLVDRLLEDSVLQPIVLKFDPGSKETGVAIVREDEGKVQHVLHLSTIRHKGQAIHNALTARRGHRRHRRATLRLREKRFDNRRRAPGWLPPSVQSRVDNIAVWTERYRRLAPVARIVSEDVRFDTQLMDDANINGVEYQQGTLGGYEVREYLLEKWGRACMYCDAKNVPFQVEHVLARSRGGSNSIRNLGLACEPCNSRKDSDLIEVFLKEDPVRLDRIMSGLKRPLRDAAAMNATRKAIVVRLKETGLPVETGTGGRTKWNRTRFGIPKAHALDAACVGIVEGVEGWKIPTLSITAMGRGLHQRMLPDAYGFPRGHRPRVKGVRGFVTGDLVRAVVPDGFKAAGTHRGRVMVRSSGSFSIRTRDGTVGPVEHRFCRVMQSADGYGYA